MQLLALSGSLRAASLNTTALRALQQLAPEGVAVALYEGVGSLPPFNPDVEMSALPEIAAALRRQVSAADGLVIACPEYAHGIPGAFKNALDWLVGMTDFPGKPVMLVNTAPRACHAQTQLVEVLTTMSARIVHEAGVTVDLRETDVSARLEAGLRIFIDVVASTTVIPGLRSRARNP